MVSADTPCSCMSSSMRRRGMHRGAQSLGLRPPVFLGSLYLPGDPAPLAVRSHIQLQPYSLKVSDTRALSHLPA
jgi:hypothetical protein